VHYSLAFTVIIAAKLQITGPGSTSLTYVKYTSINDCCDATPVSHLAALPANTGANHYTTGQITRINNTMHV
jgi:hypothetical protein